jgi:ribokinase
MNASDLSGVAVVGSANLDIVVSLDRVPDRGETVFGTAYDEHPGGKGANQAVAAARRAKTTLVASVGLDPAGQELIDYLRDRNVDTSHVIREARSTGRAFITVTPDGENSITVLSLANSTLAPDIVTGALDQIRPQVVVTQQEITEDALAAAAQWCRANQARFVLNASPTAPLSDAVLQLADPIIVNEMEARGILGVGQDSDTDEASLARALARRTKSAVLTAGSRGAFIARDARVTKIPAQPVTPIDTTGAGDEFAGTLAAGLAQGDDLLNAAARGNEAAARLIGIPRADR